jgi:hypothetical protein
MVERRLGVDLGHAPIVRDRRSTQQARQLKARGFTGDGVMHIPREAGALQEPRTKALVAHELVHVAQQRRGNVPPHPETHGAGRVLEAEAVGIEREWLRVPSPSGRMDTAGGRAPAVDLPGTGTTEGAGPVPPTPPTATGARPVGIQAAAQTGAETPAAGASERDAVTKLYEQVVARLRADLLVDRERAGTLADRR